MALSRAGKGFRLDLDAAWLADHSLIAVALDEERKQWESVGLGFELKPGSDPVFS
jgi:hypothetical protein